VFQNETHPWTQNSAESLQKKYERNVNIETPFLLNFFLSKRYQSKLTWGIRCRKTTYFDEIIERLRKFDQKLSKQMYSCVTGLQRIKFLIFIQEYRYDKFYVLKKK
jgi:hypothetical protein